MGVGCVVFVGSDATEHRAIMQGRVLEEGTHDELLAKRGAYSVLYKQHRGDGETK